MICGARRLRPHLQSSLRRSVQRSCGDCAPSSKRCRSRQWRRPRKLSAANRTVRAFVRSVGTDREGIKYMQSPRPQLASSGQAEERNPWLVLVVICTAVFMLLLDTTIVNNAQVKIREGLDANLTQIQWVLDSYILSYAVLLLSFGRLGDIFGRKHLFVIGMSIFTGASLLCAVSASLGDALGVSGVNVLIASRVLQGIG